jgi:hypothetical protein
MAINVGLTWTTRPHLEGAERLHHCNHSSSRNSSDNYRESSDLEQFHMSSNGIDYRLRDGKG